MHGLEQRSRALELIAPPRAAVFTLFLLVRPPVDIPMESKMRKSIGISLAFSLSVLLLTCSAIGQGGDPPPPCCRKFVPTDDSLPAAQLLERRISAEPAAQLRVSDDVIRRSGLTRLALVDRFAAGFFGLKSVDLLIPSTDLVDPRTLYLGRDGRDLGRRPASEEMLVAVEVRRFYSVPILLARAEDIDSVDQLFMTDGEIYVTVDFGK